MLLALILSGCADGPSRGDRTITRRDSAGIPIIEIPNARLEEIPRLTIAGEPDLRIGVVEGEEPYMFAGAVFTRTLSDGTIAVVNRQSSTIRLFSADGRFLREIGGDGEGPGEYRTIGGMVVLPGDSLLVWDARLRRFTILGPTVEVAEIRPIQVMGLNESFLGALDDGSVILRWIWITGPPDPNRNILVRVHRDSARVDTLHDEPIAAMKEIMAFGRPRWQRPLFAAEPSYVVDGSNAWLARGATWEAMRLDTAARPDLIVRALRATRAVTTEFFRWYADSVAFQGAAPEAERPEIRRMFDRAGAADSFPAMQGIAIGTDARIWMRQYGIPGEDGEPTWLVVEQDGTPVAWVEVPRRFTPYEYGTDRLLGVGRDSLNVQYVERYRLVRSGG
jgi:hypothetical protein